MAVIVVGFEAVSATGTDAAAMFTRVGIATDPVDTFDITLDRLIRTTPARMSAFRAITGSGASMDVGDSTDGGDSIAVRVSSAVVAVSGAAFVDVESEVGAAAFDVVVFAGGALAVVLEAVVVSEEAVVSEAVVLALKTRATNECRSAEPNTRGSAGFPLSRRRRAAFAGWWTTGWTQILRGRLEQTAM